MTYRRDKRVCLYLEAATSAHKMFHDTDFKCRIYLWVHTTLVFYEPLVGYRPDMNGPGLEMPRDAVIILQRCPQSMAFVLPQTYQQHIFCTAAVGAIKLESHT